MKAEITENIWIVIALVLTIASSAISIIRKNKEASKAASRRIVPMQTDAEFVPNDGAKPAFKTIQKTQRTKQESQLTSNNIQLSNALEEVETPQTGSLINEFDLRKAVLYSEILNPKFKE